MPSVISVPWLIRSVFTTTDVSDSVCPAVLVSVPGPVTVVLDRFSTNALVTRLGTRLSDPPVTFSVATVNGLFIFVTTLLKVSVPLPPLSGPRAPPLSGFETRASIFTVTTSR